MIKFNFNLKDQTKKETLVFLQCRWQNQSIKVSTGQSVAVVTWDKQLQRCKIGERFSKKINKQSKAVNDYLGRLNEKLTDMYEEKFVECLTSFEQAKLAIRKIVDELREAQTLKMKKLQSTPIEFFTSYVESNRVDKRTGRYVTERTRIHQRTVIKRLQSFLEDCNLPNQFSTFASKDFDRKYTDWCYNKRHYKENTIYATYGVLRPLLNAARDEGIEMEDHYKYLKAKCTEVDSIYLTEDEITRIYNLNIPKLVQEGEVSAKSEMENTRDLFIIGCWTGLRRSDLMRLNKALFDVDKKTITITTEKTKKQVCIPMHPYVYSLWEKYHGVFPTLSIHRSHSNDNLREAARLAGIDSVVRIVQT